MTHADGGQLSMSVCRGFNTTKLNKEDDVRKGEMDIRERFIAFSSILEEGPPPPSPFPNTSKERSEDSRF